MLTVVQELSAPNSVGASLLDEICRDGARPVPGLRPEPYPRPPSPGSPRSGKTRLARFTPGSLPGTDYVYVWVDGIHLKVGWRPTRCACW